MTLKTLHLRLGIFVCLCALFLAVYAIPNFVFAPSNVGNVVLSPLFWPYVLAGLTGVVGLGLIASAFGPEGAKHAGDDDDGLGQPEGLAPWLRVVGLVGIMVTTMLVMPKLGMVWTTMLAFAACAALFRTRHPLIAAVCTFAVPLLLYAFFAHVAGVAIPQGEFVRLP